MQFAKILLRTFLSTFIKDVGLMFPLLDVSLPGLGMRMILASKNEFGRVPSFSISWNTLQSIGMSSSLKVLQNSAENPSAPGLSLDGRFLMASSVSLLDIDLLKLCMSSWFSLGGVYVSRICQCLRQFLFCWKTVFPSSFSLCYVPHWCLS